MGHGIVRVAVESLAGRVLMLLSIACERAVHVVQEEEKEKHSRRRGVALPGATSFPLGVIPVGRIYQGVSHFPTFFSAIDSAGDRSNASFPGTSPPVWSRSAYLALSDKTPPPDPFGVSFDVLDIFYVSNPELWPVQEGLRRVGLIRAE